MTDTVIKAENLGKKYIIGHQAQNGRYVALRDVLMQNVRGAWRQVRDLAQGKPILQGDTQEEFWALKDVSFEIKRGEAVGIIGRNGAGKSTLLKILSRITEPSSGRVTIRGRVASLLEVGTGFHPELTGRENIYLNGAILGMTRQEIRRKFDEIVAFAEVDKFLDTPVKRYSSGMYVRLAFAVAAHLEPEILVVDEVLAVGDAQFQKKCLGKMGDVAHEGRTILFVSHNMGAINQLCPHSIWLDQGKIADFGETPNILYSYIHTTDELRDFPDKKFVEDVTKEAQLRRVKLLNSSGNIAQKFQCDEPINISLEIEVRVSLPAFYGYMEISRLDGTKVMVSDSYDIPPNQLDNLSVGKHIVQISIPARTLAAGEYLVYLNFTSIAGHNFNVDSPGNVCRFEIEDLTSQRGNNRAGFFSTLVEWKNQTYFSEEGLND